MLLLLRWTGLETHFFLFISFLLTLFLDTPGQLHTTTPPACKRNVVVFWCSFNSQVGCSITKNCPGDIFSPPFLYMYYSNPFYWDHHTQCQVFCCNDSRNWYWSQTMCMQVNDNNRSQDTCASDMSPAQGFSFYFSNIFVWPPLPS